MCRSVHVACYAILTLLTVCASVGRSGELACPGSAAGEPCSSERFPSDDGTKGDLIRKAICVMVAPSAPLPRPSQLGVRINSRDLGQTIPALFELARRAWNGREACEARACAGASARGQADTCSTQCVSECQECPGCVTSGGSCPDCPDCLECCDAIAEEVPAQCGDQTAAGRTQKCESEPVCEQSAACPPVCFAYGCELQDRLMGALMENERLRARLKAQQQVAELKEAYLHQLVELRQQMVEHEVEVLLAEKDAEMSKAVTDARIAKAQYEFFFEVAGEPAEVLARLARSNPRQSVCRDRLCGEKSDRSVQRIRKENRMLRARVADLEKRVSELLARMAEKPSATTR